MTKDDFIKQVINMIRATDESGYSIPYKTKVMNIHNLVDEYEKQNKQ